MQTYEILVKNRAVVPNSDDMTMVRTSVGIDQIHVLFDDPEWLDFPVTITFAQGADVVTLALPLVTLAGSEWAAEATVTVPHEVIDMVGDVRVTFQGTDSEGRHIVTARGVPLKVEEAGDVLMGDVPSDAPTVDQWQQAYADAVSAANDARSVAEELRSRIESILSDARAEIEGMLGIRPATADTLGVIKVGDRLSISEDGTLSANQQVETSVAGLTTSQASSLVNLTMLAAYAFETEFDSDGLLKDDVKVRGSALPTASVTTPGMVMPDGTTVVVDEDGMLHASYFSHSWDGTVLTTSTLDGQYSVDLLGPPIDIVEATGTVDQTIGDPSVTVTVGGEGAERTLHFEFSGIMGKQGPQGIQGPSGYVLTDEDYATITDSVVARFDLYDAVGF